MANNKVQIDIDVDTLQAIRKIAAMQQKLADTIKETELLKKKADQASNAQDRLLDRGVKADDPRAKAAAEAANKAGLAYRQATELVQRYNKSIEEQVKVLGLAGLSNKELNAYLREQNRIYNTSKRGSDEYTESIINLRKAEEELTKRREDKKGAMSFFQNAKANIAPAAIAGAVAGAGVALASNLLSTAFEKISERIENVVDKADKISVIKNAIKGTTQQAEKLNEQIGELDTRLEQTTRREILIEAGKLDVPTAQLKEYTQAMSEATITMIDDFPKGAGEMTQSFTKIKGLFKDTKDLDYPSSVRQIGSALKGLADEGTATANWQSDFLLRLGALDEKIRPTITELLGLGAALEESGLTNEIAASGVQSVLTTAYKNTDIFAKFFGQSRKDFEAFINLKPNQFLIDFAEKLKPLTASQEMQTLKNLKIESQEAGKILGVLANKTEIVADKQAKANQYFLAGTRLTELYNEKNDNLAGKLERVWNKIGNSISNSKLMSFMGGLINVLADGTLKFLDTETHLDKLNKAFTTQKQAVSSLEKGVAPLLDKYDKLTINSASASKNQAEIHKIVTSLSSILPASAIQWDKYGNAIGISTQKGRDFIAVQKAMLKAQNAVMITELTKKQEEAEAKAKELERQITGKVTKDRAGNVAWERTDYTMKDVVGLQNKILSLTELGQQHTAIKKLKEEAEQAKLAIKGLSGEAIPDAPTPTAPAGATGTGNTSFAGNASTKDDALEKARQQAEQQKINAKRLDDDLAQMAIKAIENDSDRKEAQIRYEFEKADKAEKALVEKNELTQKDYLNWREKTYANMLSDIEKNDKETNTKIAENVKEVNQKALIRRLELHKDELEAELQQAKASEDLNAIYKSEINISIAEEEIALAKATADEKEQIEKSFVKSRLALKEKYLKDSKDKEAKTEDILQENKIKELKKEEDARKKLFDKINLWQNSIAQVASAFFDFQAQDIANQQTREDNLYNKKIQNLEAQKAKGIITEGEYTAKKTAFEKEHDRKTREIKQKGAEADKVARISQAVMTTAQAIINAFAVGKEPITIAALASTAGIVGALQVAKIANTEIPQYYDGDWTHNSSGPGIDGKGGMVSITHPNEFISNARATANPQFAAVLPILDSLNQGKSISTQQITNNNSITNTSQTGGTDIALVNTLNQVVSVTAKLADKLDNLEAKISWDYSTHKDYNRSKTKYDQSNNDAYLS